MMRGLTGADGLPDTPVTQIDWTVAAGFRIATVLILLVCTFELVSMLSHYWWRVIPMRQELEQDGQELLAPPIGWTFAYHIAVTVIFVAVAIGVSQATYYGSKPTLFTWTSPVLFLAMTVIAHRFQMFYARTLKAAHTRRFHR